ncbi:hypothetical protein SXCC_04131 [Gluconacetobacter sp. SXCC-1]|nr:hypothetical protein SXCC_04131 [Gluconacetobacter sp. SXCC-1]
MSPLLVFHRGNRRADVTMFFLSVRRPACAPITPIWRQVACMAALRWRKGGKTIFQLQLIFVCNIKKTLTAFSDSFPNRRFPSTRP